MGSYADAVSLGTERPVWTHHRSDLISRKLCTLVQSTETVNQTPLKTVLVCPQARRLRHSLS